MKTIEIIIDAKGDARVQTKGFAGSACRDASALLERALGEVTAEQLTPESYQAVQAEQQQTQSN
ncbi:MAG: DUF2997 domain-containing protein [Tepidisphaeraceae bacterium]